MTASAPAFEEIRHDEQNRLFERFARLRFFVMPGPALLATLFIILEPLGWRTIVLALCCAMFVTIAVSEWLQFRRKGFAAVDWTRNWLALAVGQTLVVTATGGIESPVLPPMIIVGIGAQFFLPPLLRRSVLVLQVAAISTLLALALTSAVPSLVPQILGGGARAGHSDVLLCVAAFVITVILLVSARVIGLLRDTFAALTRRWIDARDRLLALHADQTTALTTLSAEIAHELKNPLSSIKGLAALVAGNLTGKDAERMAVLRREVDRMQDVLEEFLNFTRPLGPLSKERASLRRMAESVAQLHEGLCIARRIDLHITGPQDTVVSCDPRKLHQVVVNLLQNAIEALSDGGVIEVAVGPAAAGGARLAVLDRGSGLDPSVAARVFAPGVTTKPKGSGIGLAVARGLVAQHGGDLSLRARDGGGCVAEVLLPAAASPAA